MAFEDVRLVSARVGAGWRVATSRSGAHPLSRARPAHYQGDARLAPKRGCSGSLGRPGSTSVTLPGAPDGVPRIFYVTEGTGSCRRPTGSSSIILVHPARRPVTTRTVVAAEGSPYWFYLGDNIQSRCDNSTLPRSSRSRSSRFDERSGRDVWNPEFVWPAAVRRGISQPPPSGTSIETSYYTGMTPRRWSASSTPTGSSIASLTDGRLWNADRLR